MRAPHLRAVGVDDEPVDRDKLFALVAEKTCFSRAQFERLLDHQFGAAAPRAVKLLARDLIALPREGQEMVKLIQVCFSETKVTRIGDIQPMPGASTS